METNISIENLLDRELDLIEHVSELLTSIQTSIHVCMNGMSEGEEKTELLRVWNKLTATASQMNIAEKILTNVIEHMQDKSGQPEEFQPSPDGTNQDVVG